MNKAWLILLRPWSLTASAIPVLLGTALAWKEGYFSILVFLLALIGGMALQSGTNIINEIVDVKKGIDTLETQRDSKIILKKEVSSASAYKGAIVLFSIALIIAIYLGILRGPSIFFLGVLGILGGYYYTAEPISLKYRAMGVPLVFLLMGPFMVIGSYYVQTGYLTTTLLWLSLPIGLLVASILHANDVRDIEEDSKVQILTLSILIGKQRASMLYAILISLAYLIVIASVLKAQVGLWGLLPLVTLPLALKAIKQVLTKADLTTIDQETAKIHLSFGLLLILGVIL